MHYDELAEEFLRIPVHIYNIYKTFLPEGYYNGHLRRPTDRCALLLPLQGEAEFRFDGVPHAVSPGVALLGGVNRRLDITVPASGFTYVLAHYLPASWPDGSNLRMSGLASLRAEPDVTVLQLADSLLRVAAEPGNLASLEKHALFFKLLSRLLWADRRYHNLQSSPIMEQAMEYLRECHAEPITLQSVAERYGMKPKYFSHLFHRYTGVSPIHYLIRYRMHRAYELLTSTSCPVSEAARGVGYADAYYFSRLFKKYYGISPNSAKTRREGKHPSS